MQAEVMMIIIIHMIINMIIIMNMIMIIVSIIMTMITFAVHLSKEEERVNHFCQIFNNLFLPIRAYSLMTRWSSSSSSSCVQRYAPKS